MSKTVTPSQRITDEVTSWPGVEADPGRRGEFAFKVGRKEIGHLHGDHAAHFSFPKQVWSDLFEAGRVVHHPVFPGKPGPAARRIEDETDVRDVIALLRLNYDRAVARNRASSHPRTSRMAPQSDYSGRLAWEAVPDVEGIHASAPEPLPFAPSLEIRAFLLEREAGNVLVYSTSGLDPDAPPLAGLGGIARHYLNHGHEAMFASERIATPLFVHERERDSVAASYPIRATFSRRHLLDEDFDVIPTPGHTEGATAYLWDSGSHRFLFTGDTIYLRDGEWMAAVLPSSDRDAYVESLGLIRDLDFDVLVPWAASAGRPFYALTGREDARRRIGAVVERLRRGEDG